MEYEKSIEYQFPEIAGEWNYKMNGDLKPSEISYGSHKKVWWLGKCNHEWKAVVKNRCQGKTKCPECFKNSRIKGYISENPDLMSEWSFEDNGDISPDACTKYSNQRVVWKCKCCGHKWPASIKNRSRGTGCPKCHRGNIRWGKDFIGNFQELIKEWDYEKNKDVNIKDISRGSHYKAYWKCINGHSWRTEVKHRTLNNSGCPYCAGQKIVVGENDLRSQMPASLLDQWDYEKNNKIGIKPEAITIDCIKRVYWMCEKGHVWRATPHHRIKSDTGCPYCRGQRPIVGENDLKTLNPNWLKYWDNEKNKKKPEEYMLFSHAIVYWKCEKNHIWTRQISKMSESSTCPYCNGTRPIKGENDFETLHPELMTEWFFEKNKRVNPSCIMEHSNKKVWWICKERHEWKAMINDRTNGTGCPYCN